MEINDEEARKRQYEIDKDKYKVLFELATQEYKAELERSKSIEDKVSKLFTILNILLSLSSVAVKPPTSGGGYKATPQSCLHTDGI